jgi:type IX secretion system PorP/SprF family membrane protein
MKKLTILIALIVATTISFAQLGSPLAQYSSNQMMYNPGYAGIYNLFSANLSMRKLWVGLPGSPSFISTSVHAPLRDERQAVGFVFQREQWGAMIGNIGYGNYAHKIPLENSLLNLGLQVGFLNNAIDWTLIDHVMHEEDPGLGWGRTATTSFDVNLGAYFQSENYYAGISVKHLTMPKFGRMTNELTGEDWYSQQRMHFFFTGGYNFNVIDDWSIRPEMFVRAVYTQPTIVKVGASFIYQDRFFFKPAFHTGQKTLSLAVKGEVSPGVKIGYSYDIHFGRLQSFQRGSHEISIHYNTTMWNKPNAEIKPDLIGL